MQSFLHIVEAEVLIVIGILLFANFAVWIAMKFLTGGHRSEDSNTGQH
ncbi:MAG: hypothetical protein P1U88_12560 [Thalassobaculaceae bacterium]|nr:hypothetical protein [Thalassobaculaceae bacterium]